jgi:hypothetical protein
VAIRRSAGVVTGLLVAAALLSGCKSDGATPTSGAATPTGAGGTVELLTDHALTPAQRTATVTILQARLHALNIDGTVAASGHRGVVMRVAPSDEATAVALTVPGRLEMRQSVGSVTRKGSATVGWYASDDVPAPIVRALGKCSVPASADLEGWTLACDRPRDLSYVLKPAAVHSADVATATATVDAGSTANEPWLVDIAFTPAGQRRFTELTMRVTGSTLAILLDGVVETAVTVNTVIPGNAQISGTFTEAEATLMAALLGHGELPVPLHVGSSPVIPTATATG